MSPGMHTERAFEDAVYQLIQEQGWHPGASTWRPELGIDTGAMLQFIGATQQQAWADLVERCARGSPGPGCWAGVGAGGPDDGGTTIHYPCQREEDRHRFSLLLSIY